MKYKRNFADTQRRMEAFWNKEPLDRCCLSIPVVDKSYAGKDRRGLSAEELEKIHLDPDTVCRELLDQLEHTWFLGESLPSYMPNFGTAGYVQYFGAKPKYAPDTIWFDPVLHDPDPEKLQFQDEIFQRHAAFFREMVKRANGEFLVAMSDNCGVMDALAELRGTHQLLMDLMDHPDFVIRASEILTDALKKTNSVFFDIIKENNYGGSTHAWMHTWCSSRHGQMQCDFSVMISPEHYRKFVVRELEEMSRWMDHSTYHFDGIEQLRHLDLILGVEKIDNIQWTEVAGQPDMVNFIPVFQKIQASGKGLILIPTKLYEVKELIDQLSPKGLQIVVNGLYDPYEAENLLQYAVQSAKMR